MYVRSDKTVRSVKQNRKPKIEPSIHEDLIHSRGSIQEKMKAYEQIYKTLFPRSYLSEQKEVNTKHTSTLKLQ